MVKRYKKLPYAYQYIITLFGCIILISAMRVIFDKNITDYDITYITILSVFLAYIFMRDYKPYERRYAIAYMTEQGIRNTEYVSLGTDIFVEEVVADIIEKQGCEACVIIMIKEIT